MRTGEPTKRDTKEALRSLIRAGWSRTEVAAELEVSERCVAHWLAESVTPRRRAFRELLDLARREGVSHAG